MTYFYCVLLCISITPLKYCWLLGIGCTEEICCLPSISQENLQDGQNWCVRKGSSSKRMEPSQCSSSCFLTPFSYVFHFSAAESPLPASLRHLITVKDSFAALWKVVAAAALSVHPMHGIYLYYSPGCCWERIPTLNFGQREPGNQSSTELSIE